MAWKTLNCQLPGFGGGPLDYQLLEEEEPGTAATRLYVVADPKLGPLDEREVVDCVLSSLEGRSGAGRQACLR